jgi:hypothetical protein
MSAVRIPDWSKWWTWELELSPHILKRMIDRDFSEVDLRSMMASASRLREDEEPGRWVVGTFRGSRLWEVIVEPEGSTKLLVVITAYPVELP